MIGRMFSITQYHSFYLFVAMFCLVLAGCGVSGQTFDTSHDKLLIDSALSPELPAYEEIYALGPFGSQLGAEGVIIMKSEAKGMEIYFREVLQSDAEYTRLKTYLQTRPQPADLFVKTTLFPFHNAWVDAPDFRGPQVTCLLQMDGTSYPVYQVDLAKEGASESIPAMVTLLEYPKTIKKSTHRLVLVGIKPLAQANLNPEIDLHQVLRAEMRTVLGTNYLQAEKRDVSQSPILPLALGQACDDSQPVEVR